MGLLANSAHEPATACRSLLSPGQGQEEAPVGGPLHFMTRVIQVRTEVGHASMFQELCANREMGQVDADSGGRTGVQLMRKQARRAPG